MTATLPDGRAVVWSPRPPHLSGDSHLVVGVQAYLAARDWVDTTADAPNVPAEESIRLAVFLAVSGMFPDAAWTNPPFGLVLHRDY